MGVSLVAERRGPLLVSEADGTGRGRCRDGVVILLDAVDGRRGTVVVLGGEGLVQAGVEVLRTAQANVGSLRSRHCDVGQERTRHFEKEEGEGIVWFVWCVIESRGFKCGV